MLNLEYFIFISWCLQPTISERGKKKEIHRKRVSLGSNLPILHSISTIFLCLVQYRPFQPPRRCLVSISCVCVYKVLLHWERRRRAKVFFLFHIVPTSFGSTKWSPICSRVIRMRFPYPHRSIVVMSARFLWLGLSSDLTSIGQWRGRSSLTDQKDIFQPVRCIIC